MRRSRENRAMASRTAFGRQMIAGQWAAAEFAALCRLWEIGAGHAAPCRTRCRCGGTELMLEFIGDAERGRPRPGWPSCGRTRPSCATCGPSWSRRCGVLARAGYAHGDLSPYNLLVHEGRLVLIDLPQVVDVVANPQGPEFLARDVRVVGDLVRGPGLPGEQVDPGRVDRSAAARGGPALIERVGRPRRPTRMSAIGGSAPPRAWGVRPGRPGRRAGLPGGPPAAQQVPALVEGLLQLAQSLAGVALGARLVGLGVGTQPVFLVDQFGDPVQDGLVVHATEPGTGCRASPGFGGTGASWVTGPHRPARGRQSGADAAARSAARGRFAHGAGSSAHRAWCRS